MKTDNDAMIGAGRLVQTAGMGLISFFLLGSCCVASVTEAVSHEKASLPEVRMVPRKVALFKNGYGCVTLEGKTAEGISMELTGLPTPSYGSFWLSAEPGVSVRELVSSKVSLVVPKPNYGKSELLAANAGKLVRITTDQGNLMAGRVVEPEKNSVLKARLPHLMDSISTPEEVAGDMCRPSSLLGGSVLLQMETGCVLLQESSIRQIEFLDRDISFPVGTADRTRLVMKLEKSVPGKTVVASSLSSGISWLPSYRVELGPEGQGHLRCKATIMNELMDLDKVEMELISGFPSLVMPGLPSPIAMKQNMNTLFAALGSATPGTDYARSLMSNYMAQSRSSQPVVEMAAVSGRSIIKQSEDLFFYSIPDFSCSYKERVTRELFDGNVSFRHVYTWDIPDQEILEKWNRNRSRGDGISSPLDVWHCIQLTNTLNMPWTTGMVEFISGGRLAGQSTLTFTNPGEQVLVKLNKSMEAIVHLSEKTLSSEEIQHDGCRRRKYTVQGTLSMKNASGKDMEMQVGKAVIGSPASVSEDGEMSSLPNWNRSLNPDGKFQWETTLKSGAEKELTYQYTYLD